MANIEDGHFFQRSGTLPGPSIMIIGGTHGNERTGVEVVRRLVRDITEGKQNLFAGKLTLVLGNIPAIVQNVRGVEGRDLNRYFSPRALANDDGSAEYRRAHELVPYIAAADVVIDLHATNKPSVPFVCSKNDAAHREVFRWFAPECILADPNFFLGGGASVTIDECADSIGKIGICFEAGWVGDDSLIANVYESAVRYLVSVGVLHGKKQDAPPYVAPVYEMVDAILRDDRIFAFAEGKGLSSFEKICEGEVIGYHDADPVTSRHNGVIVFPKLPEHQSIGKPVCYIAKHIAESE